MSPFFPLAVASDPVTWLGIVGGIIGSGSVGALLVAVFNRRGKLADDRTTESKARQKDDATVEVAKVAAAASAEARYFEGLTKLASERQADMETLRREMDAMKRTFGHEVRGLQNQIRLSHEVYHQLYNTTSILVMQYRIMRARLKRLDAAFDEAEFPDIDIKPFDPKELFDRLNPPATDQAQVTFAMPAEDLKKLTGRINLNTGTNSQP